MPSSERSARRPSEPDNVILEPSPGGSIKCGITATRLFLILIIASVGIFFVLVGYENVPKLRHEGIIDKLNPLFLQSIPEWPDINNTNPSLSYKNVLVQRKLTSDDIFPIRNRGDIKDSVSIMHGLLESYIRQLDEIREQFLVEDIPWQFSNNKSREIANAYDSNYFSIIAKYNQIKTLFLNVSMENVKKYFIGNFYQYSSSNCDLIEKRAIYGHNDGNRYFNKSCKSEIGALLKPYPFDVSQVVNGFPEDYRQGPSQATLTYLHVMSNAIVTASGDVFTDSLKIVPQHCQQNTKLNNAPNPHDLKLYHEVLSVAQFWGSGFFHGMVEQLPRIAAYIRFLQSHPQVKLHMESTTSFLDHLLERLGVDPIRVIIGNIRARILYLPAGTACGRPGFFNTHVLSLYYRNGIPDPPEPRISIIIIKRSTKRFFNHHKEIHEKITTAAARYGLRVEVFPDAPVPPLHKAVAMFNRAFAVVGPHGAGFANVFFSEPGTMVIEGLCDVKERYNLCYRNLAAQLGHRYYGVVSAQYRCLETKPHDILPVLNHFIQIFNPIN